MNSMHKKKRFFTLLFLIGTVLFIHPDEEGETTPSYPPQAILVASYMGNEKLVLEILEAGADRDVRDSLGATALHIAIFQHKLSIVKILLEHGFDPNAKTTKTGSTPLHHAVAVNNPAAAKLLLQYGADLRIRNNEGQTPLEKAKKEGKAALVNILY